MRAFIRRVAIPLIAFVFGLGIEIGNFESRRVAFALFGFAAVWGIIALLTWPPIATRTHFPWTIEFRSRKIQTPTSTEPAWLIQFAKASFIPAWHACIQVILDIRSAIQVNEGQRVHEMFQLLLEKGHPHWLALDAKVREGCGSQPLSEYLGAAYVQYELMVRWIELGGEPYGYPKADENLERWLRLDAKMVDSLDNAVAIPGQDNSELAKARLHAVNTQMPEVRRRLSSPRPAPPAPDEREVILWRANAYPAYGAAYALLIAATKACFSVGGWQGLAARLVKDFAGTVSAEGAQAACEEAIASSRRGAFDEVMYTFLANYHNVMRWVYQFGAIGDIKLDAALYRRWQIADRDFMKEWRTLAKGLHHEELKEMLQSYELQAAEIKGYLLEFEASLVDADLATNQPVTPS